MPLNADGLNVNYGPAEAGPARVTEYRTHGPKRFVEIIIDADFLPASGTIQFDEYTLPLNGNIERLEVGPETETWAGGTSIQVNGVAKDGTAVVAIGAAITLANLNAMATQENLDIQLTEMKKISLTTVGTFTTGKGTIRVFFSVPKEETDTLVWDKTLV